MPLTLVHPPRGGNGGSPPSRRKGFPAPALSLTEEEARHLRAATKNIARAQYGSLRRLAVALEVDPNILTRKKHPGPGLAVALWRLTGTPLEALLSPTLAAVPGSRGGAA